MITAVVPANQTHIILHLEAPPRIAVKDTIGQEAIVRQAQTDRLLAAKLDMDMKILPRLVQEVEVAPGPAAHANAPVIQDLLDHLIVLVQTPNLATMTLQQLAPEEGVHGQEVLANALAHLGLEDTLRLKIPDNSSHPNQHISHPNNKSQRLHLPHLSHQAGLRHLPLIPVLPARQTMLLRPQPNQLHRLQANLHQSRHRYKEFKLLKISFSWCGAASSDNNLMVQVDKISPTYI